MGVARPLRYSSWGVAKWPNSNGLAHSVIVCSRKVKISDLTVMPSKVRMHHCGRVTNSAAHRRETNGSVPPWLFIAGAIVFVLVIYMGISAIAGPSGAGGSDSSADQAQTQQAVDTAGSLPATADPSPAATPSPGATIRPPTGTDAVPQPTSPVSEPKPRSTMHKPSPKPDQTDSGIHPGAVCSTPWASGLSSRGTLMECKPTGADSTFRWRPA